MKTKNKKLVMYGSYNDETLITEVTGKESKENAKKVYEFLTYNCSCAFMRELLIQFKEDGN